MSVSQTIQLHSTMRVLQALIYKGIRRANTAGIVADIAQFVPRTSLLIQEEGNREYVEFDASRLMMEWRRWEEGTERQPQGATATAIWRGYLETHEITAAMKSKDFLGRNPPITTLVRRREVLRAMIGGFPDVLSRVIRRTVRENQAIGHDSQPTYSNAHKHLGGKKQIPNIYVPGNADIPARPAQMTLLALHDELEAVADGMAFQREDADVEMIKNVEPTGRFRVITRNQTMHRLFRQLNRRPKIQGPNHVDNQWQGQLEVSIDQDDLPANIDPLGYDLFPLSTDSAASPDTINTNLFGPAISGVPKSHLLSVPRPPVGVDQEDRKFFERKMYLGQDADILCVPGHWELTGTVSTTGVR